MREAYLRLPGLDNNFDTLEKLTTQNENKDWKSLSDNEGVLNSLKNAANKLFYRYN